jgi:hypothetical protein
VDVDGIVAWWLAEYLDAEMSGPDLVAALRDLDSQLPARYPDERKLAVLIGDVETAVTGADARSDAEDAATRFLGSHPAEVVKTRGSRQCSTWSHRGRSGRA